jgi:hypothetical protein
MNLDKLIDVQKDGKKFLKASPFHDSLQEIEKVYMNLCTSMTIKMNQMKLKKKNPVVTLA